MPAAVLGVSDHAGWAALVVASADGTLLDRRRVELVEPGLPPMPHHHEGQHMPVAEAVALVEQVRASAERCARAALEAVAADTPDVAEIALRACPELPPTTAERLQNYRARNTADWVMYRQALAAAAEERGWRLYWYDPKRLALETLAAHFARVRRSAGPPWGQDQKQAMAAAMQAAGRTSDNVYYGK